MNLEDAHIDLVDTQAEGSGTAIAYSVLLNLGKYDAMYNKALTSNASTVSHGLTFGTNLDVTLQITADMAPTGGTWSTLTAVQTKNLVKFLNTLDASGVDKVSIDDAVQTSINTSLTANGLEGLSLQLNAAHQIYPTGYTPGHHDVTLLGSTSIGSGSGSGSGSGTGSGAGSGSGSGS